MMRTRTNLWLGLLLGLGTMGCGGGSGGSEDLCKDVDCSGHGECGVVAEQPLCDCEDGYLVSSDGTRCVPGVEDPCREYDCSNFGRCRVDADDNPYCECNSGYFPTGDGLDCIANTCSEDCGLRNCCGDHCCEPVASNVSEFGDLPASGSSKTASGSFDTENDCSAGSALGDCELLSLVYSPDVCVCRVGDLKITGTLKVTGEPALAILAATTILVEGTIDLSASMEHAGPGAEAQSLPASYRLGGMGGTFGSLGGNAPLGSALRGTKELVPLLGGENGQDSCGDRLGGGAGGGIQLSARVSVTVTGAIHANGGGGQGGLGAPDVGDSCVGAAGGGSGGGILIEAPQVTISGAIYAHGGGGGGGGNSTGGAGAAGSDASATGTPALGGGGRADGIGCPEDHTLDGGDGGEGSVGDSPGGSGQGTDRILCFEEENSHFVGGGGGGGASGRVRVMTWGASSCTCTGTFSPSATQGVLKGG